MFRDVVWMLRQPRYAALSVFMVLLAATCVLAGTWQVSRFHQKVHENDLLRANAHAAAVPLSALAVPLAGDGPAPSRNAIRYRTVSVTGTYLGGAQQYLRDQSVNDASGYYVLDPLRTSGGVLLVERGFVADNGLSPTPPRVAEPPAGTVQIVGRLQTPDTNNDGYTEIGHREVQSVNPVEQAGRLGAPVYDAYLTLNPHQPGTGGLTALPGPDLSNPAGGAQEWQHFAYIIQWFAFALLALAAPIAVCAHELKEGRRKFLGIDPGEEQFDALYAPSEPRLELTAGSSGGELVMREGGTLAMRGEVTAAQWARAVRLADRYGRTIGRTKPERLGPVRHPVARIGPLDGSRPLVPNSADQPYRSEDAYHGAYNDYLWELALSDGNIPEVQLPEQEQDDTEV